MAESPSQNERSASHNDLENERSRNSKDDDDDDALRLRRETEVPRYIPQQGTGGSVLGGAGTQGSVISTTNTPLMGPGAATIPQLSDNNAAITSNKQNGAGYFPPYASPNEVDRDASSKSQQYGHMYMPHDQGTDAPLSTAGLSTPSSGFGYSPGSFSPYQSGSGPAGSASAATVNGASPDWLPSPVAEEREDVTSNAASNATSSLSKEIEDLAMQGIQVVPSSSKPKAAVTTEAKPAASQPAAVHQTSPLKTAIQPSSASPSPTPSRAPSVGPPPTQPPAASRPVMPEQKKSILGKLFNHNKDKDHHKNGDHSADSSARASPVPSLHPQPEHSGLTASRPSTANKDNKASSRDRANSTSASAYTSGAESDSGTHVSTMSRNPSTTAKEKESGGGTFSSFLGRRSSNKKMEKPDPTLVAMKKSAGLANKSAISMENSPNASSTTVSSPGLPTGAASNPHPALGASSLAVPGQLAGTGPSSMVASLASTPEPTLAKDRTASPSPARHPADAKPTGSSMFRRPSGGAASLTEGHRNGVNSGTHTPATDERHQVKEKSLKEHLAALGSSSMMGKLHRKSSQTSRKSDDGKSDRSHHDEPGHHTGDSGHGHVAQPPQPKRAPSVAGSNASTSLLQKYGVCEKVAIGKGATAVVRLAHKWDRSSEKLYAVKEFRKRRKNETEKEYVKKLTSEFCISSTLHHINVVETVDLVQNEEKHWCEVMEYCPGGDLYAAIKKGDMTTALMNNYFKQIITGVAYLHSMGVAHRDIKPENLLLDGRGHLKITDFGVSDVFRMCWEKQTHMSKGLCGSEPYIAPEQFEQKEYDARLVDVWACAVVFYCMQAQELPWRVAKPSDPSFQEYIQLYARSPSPQPLGNLHPKECRSIVKKMLDPNPKTRIGSEAVLADAWMKAIDYDVLPTDPVTPLP